MTCANPIFPSDDFHHDDATLESIAADDAHDQRECRAAEMEWDAAHRESDGSLVENIVAVNPNYAAGVLACITAVIGLFDGRAA